MEEINGQSEVLLKEAFNQINDHEERLDAIEDLLVNQIEEKDDRKTQNTK